MTAKTASSPVMMDEPFLPWVESANDRRFRRILAASIALFTLVGVVVPFLPVPEIVKKDPDTVAPRLSRLIMEQKKQPPPAPTVKKQIEKKPVEKKKAVDKKEAAYRKAASSGLVALSSELEDLREDFDFSAAADVPLKKSKGIEKQSFEKDVITSRVTRASAGIDTGKLTRSTGEQQQLSARTTTKVDSPIGEKVAMAASRSSSGGKTFRSEREIEQVFQKNKGAIYSIYNRALRKDPTLAGKVVIELTISPEGKVIKCTIVSSELNASALERKIIARIKLFRFKPGNVEQTRIKYPIDFLPS